MRVLRMTIYDNSNNRNISVSTESSCQLIGSSNTKLIRIYQELEKAFSETTTRHDKLDGLIMETPDDKRLFTLTAEEVDTVVSTFDYAIQKQTEWYTFNEHRLDDDDKATVNRIIERKRNLLNRIKQMAG